MAVPPPWLGLFQDSHIDHDATQVFVQAGYSREVAEKLGPTITTVIFVRDGESFVHTISTPSARSICTRRFRLDHEDEVAGVKGSYHWEEPSRTLASSFRTSTGDSFSIDFVFDADFRHVTKIRRAGTLEARQQMHRLE